MEEAQRYAEEESLLFFETSAKTAENVSTVFEAIAKKLPLERPKPSRAAAQGAGNVSLNQQNQGEQAGCAC